MVQLGILCMLLVDFSPQPTDGTLSSLSVQDWHRDLEDPKETVRLVFLALRASILCPRESLSYAEVGHVVAPKSLVRDPSDFVKPILQ
jgi:hypothetical protein